MKDPEDDGKILLAVFAMLATVSIGAITLLTSAVKRKDKKEIGYDKF